MFYQISLNLNSYVCNILLQLHLCSLKEHHCSFSKSSKLLYRCLLISLHQCGCNNPCSIQMRNYPWSSTKMIEMPFLVSPIIPQLDNSLLHGLLYKSSKGLSKDLFNIVLIQNRLNFIRVHIPSLTCLDLHQF
jgi:hypothetical protein